MEIRRARTDEAEAITALALRSKAFWGYSAEFMEKVRAELTTRPEEVEPLRAHVAAEQGTLLGFFTVAGAPPEGVLDSLYVDPSAMGRGIGRALLEAARDFARGEGFRELVIHADPYAETFYLRQGATRIGDVASGSIPGRRLPLMRMALEQAASPGLGPPPR